MNELFHRRSIQALFLASIITSKINQCKVLIVSPTLPMNMKDS
jgi:hypothetical protein